MPGTESPAVSDAIRALRHYRPDNQCTITPIQASYLIERRLRQAGKLGPVLSDCTPRHLARHPALGTYMDRGRLHPRKT